MSFLRFGGGRLKPKLTLRSFSELSRLRAPVGDEHVPDGNESDRSFLAQRVVFAMRSGDDEKDPRRHD
jgi:hypothetical protein